MKTAKKIMSIILAITMLAGTIFSNSNNASAAGKSLGKMGLHWNLKSGKTYKVPHRILYQNDLKWGKVKIKNFKKANAKKKGYKQITFTFEFQGKNAKLKKETILNMSQVGYTYDTSYYYTIADYATGTSLEGKNKFNVTVKSSKWKTTYYEKQHAMGHFVEGDEDFDNWIRLTKKATTKVTVIYPKTYKNLCIGVGGYTGVFDENVDQEKKDKAYWKGKTTFDKTYMYKKGKKYAYFMRVK